MQVLSHIEQTNSNALRIEEGLSRFTITGDSAVLMIYRRELQMATDHFIELLKLTKDNPSQLNRIDSLRNVGRRKIDLYEAVIASRDTSKQQAETLIASPDNQAMSARVKTIMNGMRDDENHLLQERIARSNVELNKFKITFIGLMMTMLIMLAGVFALINRGFRTILREKAKTTALNDELEAFTYSVSHDLRAPLRSIRGFSELMKNDYGTTLDKEGNRKLDRIMVNASRMGFLIDDLLNFSRIGRKPMSPSLINMGSLATEAIDELIDNEAVIRDGIRIHTLPDIRGDASMIKQVWVNLLSNAIKYSRNTPDPQIEIGCLKGNSNDVFYVRDNGIGFDMKYSDKLFNVFQRLHNSTEFEGTGVGLALAHRIITRHDGKIWVDSKPNKGATFFFTIPHY
jgi:signal transduction histidine kinase